jgi:beta-lactamase regulating signal transducer with metallopeptidase domain
MKLLDLILNSSSIQAFGWALFHSLWQAVSLAVLLKGILSLTRKSSANTRYLLSCVILSLMMLLPVSTALWNGGAKTYADSVAAKLQTSAATGEKEKSTPAASSQTNISETQSAYNLLMYKAEKQFLPWTVLIWALGVFVCSVRLLGIWTYTQRLGRSEKNAVLDEWRESLEKIARQLRVSRPVLLLESSMVKVPTVIGWIKPLILIPSSALTGLTPQQFELILAHELAHIRRHDYLVNLFQTIVETLLFYHPAVWWASKQIRKERENACDDLAVRAGGGDANAAAIYARALIEMERLRKSAPSLAMAADGGSLANRIQRLVGETSHSRRFAGLWTVIFISFFMIAAVEITKRDSSVIQASERADDSLLNLPPLTISDLQEGARAAQNTIKGEWTAELNRGNSGEIQLKIQKRSKGGGFNGSINTLSPSDLEGLTPENVSSTGEANVTFRINREAGNFVFEGSFSEGKGAGVWTLKPAQGFVREMRRRGYDNLPENYLFYAATENIGARLVDDMDAAGYGLSFKELIEAASYKITPELIASWRAAGFNNLSFEELVKLAENDVTPEFFNRIKAEGFSGATPDELIELRARRR